MVCFDTGHEVTSAQATVVKDNGSIGRQTFTMTAPTGKKPISGGVDIPFSPGGDHATLLASYPSGNDWVFVFQNGNNAIHVVDLYLISAFA